MGMMGTLAWSAMMNLFALTVKVLIPHPLLNARCGLEKKEVSRIRVERGVTFSEAHRIVNTSAASSSVARKTFKDMSTQTELDTPDKGITAPQTASCLKDAE